ncbi:MAG: DUF6057 family protein [Bacteroidales bacterium]|jgi:hypothetical protein|nr:DUF6057 family protein [Bacteroidales bacterium]
MRKVSSLVFGLGVFLFFWLLVPYHLRFHEQFQFFRFGTDYFLDSVLHPEGFSFYLGGFFTQFFLYPWAGALIIALLLVLMQRLVARIHTGFLTEWLVEFLAEFLAVPTSTLFCIH